MSYPFHRERITASASDTVTATASETAFAKLHEILANTLRVGDVIKLSGMARATSTNGSDTVTLKVKFGTLVVCISAAHNLDNDDFINFESEITIEAIGPGSTAKASFVGKTWLGKAAGHATPAFNVVNDSKKTDSGFSTQADFNVTVTATHSSNNAGNITRLDVFNLERIPAKM